MADRAQLRHRRRSGCRPWARDDDPRGCAALRQRGLVAVAHDGIRRPCGTGCASVAVAQRRDPTRGDTPDTTAAAAGVRSRRTRQLDLRRARRRTPGPLHRPVGRRGTPGVPRSAPAHRLRHRPGQRQHRRRLGLARRPQGQGPVGRQRLHHRGSGGIAAGAAADGQAVSHRSARHRGPHPRARARAARCSIRSACATSTCACGSPDRTWKTCFR